MTDLGESVVDARVRLGMTQKTLAARLGVSQAHYSKVAGRVVQPSSELADRMKEWFEEIGATPLDGKQARAITLARSIRQQSRELAELLRSTASGGALRPVRRARLKHRDAE